MPTVTYEGPGPLVRMLMQDLTADGFDVQPVRTRTAAPGGQEQRDAGQVAQDVVVYLAVKARDEAAGLVIGAVLKEAVARFRRKAPGAKVTVEDDDA